MKQIALLLIFIGILTQFCFGQLTVNIGVKYHRSDNTYSDYYFRDIDLLTGVELNTRTKTQNYDRYSDYALVWFSQNEVAIIKLKDKIQTDVDRLMGKPISKFGLDFNCQIYGYQKEGTDQDGTVWKLCFYSDVLRTLCN